MKKRDKSMNGIEKNERELYSFSSFQLSSVLTNTKTKKGSPEGLFVACKNEKYF
jgi:hypothetical protein